MWFDFNGLPSFFRSFSFLTVSKSTWAGARRCWRASILWNKAGGERDQSGSADGHGRHRGVSVVVVVVVVVAGCGGMKVTVTSLSEISNSWCAWRVILSVSSWHVMLIVTWPWNSPSSRKGWSSSRYPAGATSRGNLVSEMCSSEEIKSMLLLLLCKCHSVTKMLAWQKKKKAEETIEIYLQSWIYS